MKEVALFIFRSIDQAREINISDNEYSMTLNDNTKVMISLSINYEFNSELALYINDVSFYTGLKMSDPLRRSLVALQGARYEMRSKKARDSKVAVHAKFKELTQVGK